MKMKLSTLLTSFCALFIAVLVGTASPADARDLTIVGWGGTTQAAHKIAYFDPFMKETSLKIVEDEWNGEMAKIRGMVETGNVSWDVVQVEAPEAYQGCEEGLFEMLDWSKVTDKNNLVDGAAMECGAGVLIWSTILAYDANEIKDGPKSWADFWNVKKWPGKRALRKNAKPSLEIALMADGVPASDVYKVLSSEEGVQRAFKKLDELKPHLQWWEAGAQPPQWLASGDVIMTSAYNGRISAAIKEGRNFKIVWTGQNYAVDSWVIVKGSSNLDLAYEFIKFASQPENQAVSAAAVPYGPTNVKAVAAVDPKIAPDLPTYPANLVGSVATDADWWVDHIEELSERFNVWAAQ